MSTVKSIIIRPARKADPVRIKKAVITSTGLTGDHYNKENGQRQVTLIAKDDLAKVSAIVGFRGDAHIASRRNIMVESFPHDDLKGKIIRVGKKVLLEITGYCTPCFRMDENFGEGAIAAFDRRAGWIAKVIEGGTISEGDEFFVK